MNGIWIYISSIFYFIFLFGCQTATKTESGAPNMVFIIADDLAWNAGKLYRSKNKIEGSATHTKMDDIAKIEGEGSGTLADGKTFKFIHVFGKLQDRI